MTVRLVAILILLIPLRVWAGDWMAIAMLPGQIQPPAAMPVDCPGHVTVDEKSEGEPQDCCESCELCLPFARASVLVTVVESPSPDAVASGGETSFLSADLLSARKPPWS